MVLAEVPLWVIHTSSSGGGANGILGSPNGHSNNVQKHGIQDRLHNVDRARDSLGLLAEGMGGGMQKAAIYSVDMHPSGQKFATGGGDGTVRLWNTSALFKNQKLDDDDRTKRGKYSQKGAYESSGESSAEGNGPGEIDGTDDQVGDGEGGDNNNNDASDDMSDEQEVVHDLSNLVRRKKDGSVSSPSKAQPNISAAAATSPQRQHKHTTAHHRLLCSLSAHTGSSVLSVRFSTNGQYLASAGDDSVVCIYAPSKTGSIGGNIDHHSSVEHWTRVKLCRGHALDVVGLAWAPDDSHLVSCSLDSNTPIIVWKLTDLAVGQRPTHANVLCNPYKILGKGIHTSTVKGVTFDPAGTYLASSGDDPSVCVWRAYDDWGLERRVDASAGIFRRWKEGDSQALSSQTLFRRLSWSTDGAYICSTNSVVKNKHVASTIARDGWGVSSAKSVAAGAAHLVGHKQPVVVSRHCPFLLDASKDGSGTSDEEPEYATLLALGDKRGFVTVWSTRQSRPVFKLQCSENRCTVTDLTWGRRNGDLVLIVSLLDGQVVALLFGVPSELGKVLKPQDQARVFQLRYGIDLNEIGERGMRRLFVGENSGPKLIENALQFTLEGRDDEEDEDNDSGIENVNRPAEPNKDVRATQGESMGKGGKKRIRPVLMGVEDNDTTKKSKPVTNGETKAPKKRSDPLQDAMESAERAASGAEAAASQKTRQDPATGESSVPDQHQNIHNGEAGAFQTIPHQRHAPAGGTTQTFTPKIPHSTDRIHSVELPMSKPTVMVAALEPTNGSGTTKFVADCTNSIQVPQRSSGSALSCTALTISRNGQAMWRDQLPGTSCSAIAACNQLLAVGTNDGCVQLYATSPSLGWASGTSFRSHPPLVFGAPIVTLQLHENTRENNGDFATGQQAELLVVDANGNFGVYKVLPELKMRYKGSLLAPMTHMSLSTDMSNGIHLPKLARIQITDTRRLMLILSFQSPPQGRSAHHHSEESHRSNQNQHNNYGVNGGTPSAGAGGSLQAFVYNESAELWMRISDSRFVLSDFYSTLPGIGSSQKKKRTPSVLSGGTGGGSELAGYDDMVRMGAIASNLKPSRRGGGTRTGSGHADSVYRNAVEDSGDDIATRSHCEDRMACAMALGSASEFEHWLCLYVRTLTLCGHEGLLRLVVDMLLPSMEFSQNGHSNFKTDRMDVDGDKSSSSISEFPSCWWLSDAAEILDLDRTKVIRSIVIPEMSKNRALQRLLNEIAVEVDSLSKK